MVVRARQLTLLAALSILSLCLPVGDLAAQDVPAPASPSAPDPHQWRRGTGPLTPAEIEHLARDTAYEGARPQSGESSQIEGTGWTPRVWDQTGGLTRHMDDRYQGGRNPDALAMRGDEPFRQHLKLNGLELVNHVDDRQTGLQASLVRDTHHPQNVYVLFRGTEGANPMDFTNDWGADLLDSGVGRTQYTLNRQKLGEWASGHTGLTVVGHSLGGALAQRFVADHPGAVREVVTFNSPGVDADLAKQVRERGILLPPITYYLNSNDIVSHRGGWEQLPGRVFMVDDPPITGGPGQRVAAYYGAHSKFMLGDGKPPLREVDFQQYLATRAPTVGGMHTREQTLGTPGPPKLGPLPLPWEERARLNERLDTGLGLFIQCSLVEADKAFRLVAFDSAVQSDAGYAALRQVALGALSKVAAVEAQLTAAREALQRARGTLPCGAASCVQTLDGIALAVLPPACAAPLRAEILAVRAQAQEQLDTVAAMEARVVEGKTQLRSCGFAAARALFADPVFQDARVCPLEQGLASSAKVLAALAGRLEAVGGVVDQRLKTGTTALALGQRTRAEEAAAQTLALLAKVPAEAADCFETERDRAARIRALATSKTELPPWLLGGAATRSAPRTGSGESAGDPLDRAKGQLQSDAQAVESQKEQERIGRENAERLRREQLAREQAEREQQARLRQQQERARQEREAQVQRERQERAEADAQREREEVARREWQRQQQGGQSASGGSDLLTAFAAGLAQSLAQGQAPPRTPGPVASSASRPLPAPMPSARPEQPRVAVARPPSGDQGPFAVFLLTSASNGLYLGSEASLRTRTRCSFEGGGRGCGPADTVVYRRLLGPFATRAEAQAALCRSITARKVVALGIGLKGQWQGSETWYGLWDGSVSADCHSARR